MIPIKSAQITLHPMSPTAKAGGGNSRQSVCGAFMRGEDMISHSIDGKPMATRLSVRNCDDQTVLEFYGRDGNFLCMYTLAEMKAKVNGAKSTKAKPARAKCSEVTIACVNRAIKEAKATKSVSDIIRASDMLAKYLRETKQPCSWARVTDLLRRKSGLIAPDYDDANKIRNTMMNRAMWQNSVTKGLVPQGKSARVSLETKVINLSVDDIVF